MADKEEPGNQAEPNNQAQPDNQIKPDYQAPPPYKAQADYPSPPCFLTQQPSNQETPLLENPPVNTPQSIQEPVVIGVVVS